MKMAMEKHSLAFAIALVGAVIAGAARAEPGSGFTQWLNDAALTARIKTKLLLSRYVDGLGIGVDTENGVTTLRGTVPSGEQRFRAEEIARHGGGPRGIDNEIRVSGRTVTGDADHRQQP